MDDCTQEQVRAWLKRNIRSYCDGNELDVNRLALITARKFKHSQWARDPDHWLFDEILCLANKMRLDIGFDREANIDCNDYSPEALRVKLRQWPLKVVRSLIWVRRQ